MYFGGGDYSGTNSNKMGAYTYVGLDAEGEPYWQDASGTYFLYKYTFSDGGLRWYIGADITSTIVSWYSSTGVTIDPTEASSWHVWGSSVWTEQSAVSVTCVDGGESLLPSLVTLLHT